MNSDGREKRDRGHLRRETETVCEQEGRQRIDHLVRRTEANLSTTRLLKLPCERSSEDKIGELGKETRGRVRITTSTRRRSEEKRERTAEVVRLTDSMIAYQSRTPSGMAVFDHCLA